jgi:hypothetical protein
MKRWVWRIAIFTVAVCCASNFGLFSQELKGLPESAAEWRLDDQQTRTPVPAEWAQFRKNEYARKAWRGTYRGDPPMTVTVYDMQGSGFDALQQWRVTPGKLAFLKGGYFGIVESPEASAEAMTRFARGVEAALPPGSELLR